MKKRCSKCGLLLDSTMFHKHPNTSDGLQSQCKSCNYDQKKINNPAYTGARVRQQEGKYFRHQFLITI